MQTLIENTRVALDGLRSNKLRAFLTMIGITIGVAAVIVLVSIGQAVQTLVNDQFEGIGLSLLFIIPFDEEGNLTPITADDVAAVSDLFSVPDVAEVMPQLNINNRTIVSDGLQITNPVLGVQPNYPQIFSREVIAGRFIDQTDMDAASRVAVIGQRIVDQLFPNTYPIGQTLRIGGVRFTVIGVLDQGDEFGPPGSQDNALLVPLTTAQLRLSGDRDLSGQRRVSFIIAQARSSSVIQSAIQQIRLALREEREISFRDEDNFQVLASNEILNTFQNITGLITIFLGVLAGISLLVGGIGIMNIMLVTVTERTREIGLRKAVGARNGDILMQFLTESSVVALVGGGIGIGAAAIFSALVSLAVPDLQVTVQLDSVLLATAISIAIGVFFGIYPANRAAQLNPIDALRYE